MSDIRAHSSSPLLAFYGRIAEMRYLFTIASLRSEALQLVCTDQSSSPNFHIYIQCLVGFTSATGRHRLHSLNRRGVRSHNIFPRCDLYLVKYIFLTTGFGYTTGYGLLWSHCAADADIIFLPVVSIFFLIFPRLISAVGDCMSTILRHMAWP